MSAAAVLLILVLATGVAWVMAQLLDRITWLVLPHLMALGVPLDRSSFNAAVLSTCWQPPTSGGKSARKMARRTKRGY